MFYIENLLSIWGAMFLPWALLLVLAPLLVLLICIVVYQLKKPEATGEVDIYKPLPGVQTAGKRWVAAGWAVLLTALVMYVLDACLCLNAMKRPAQSAWNDKMTVQWEKVLKKHALPLPGPAESLVLWGQKTGLDRTKELVAIFPENVQEAVFSKLKELDEAHQEILDICQEFGMAPESLESPGAAMRSLAKNADKGNAEKLWIYLIPKSWQAKLRDLLLEDAYKTTDLEYYALYYGHMKWFRWMLPNLCWVRYFPFAIIWLIVALCVVAAGQKMKRSKKTMLLSKKTRNFLRSNMP